MILGILFAIGIVGGFILLIPSFIIWVAHEHSQAKKYRHLMFLAEQSQKFAKPVTGAERVSR